MTHTFDAPVKSAGGGGYYVEVPFDVLAAFGTARPKVVVTFDGHRYRGSIAPMRGCSMLPILKEIRAAIGKGEGDAVRVTVEPDTAPREVDVPPELAAALAERPDAAARFERMSYTHRKEYAQWITDAKRPETRARRLAKAVELIAEGRPAQM